jgi:hypothetical protein
VNIWLSLPCDCASPSFIWSVARHLKWTALVADWELMSHSGSTGKLWSESTQFSKDTCSSKYIKFYWQYNTQYIDLPLACKWKQGSHLLNVGRGRIVQTKGFQSVGHIPLRGYDWFSGGGVGHVVCMKNYFKQNMEKHWNPLLGWGSLVVIQYYRILTRRALTVLGSKWKYKSAYCWGPFPTYKCVWHSTENSSFSINILNTMAN